MVAQRYVEAFPVDELVEHPDNPRRGDEEAIAESMNVHGFYGAVLVQASSNRIIAGNHRTRVARSRGEAAVPALVLDVDDDQARRILLVDNRTNDVAGYNRTELVELLEALNVTEAALAGTGFDVGDLNELLRHFDPGRPDRVIEPPEDVRTQRGDLWILGEHRLLCGDASDGDDVARLLDGITPSLMVTDPPYLVAYKGGSRPPGQSNVDWSKFAPIDDAQPELYDLFLARALEHCSVDVIVYQWHAHSGAVTLANAWEKHGLLWHQTVFWLKRMSVFTRMHFLNTIEPCAYGWRRGHQPPQARRPPTTATQHWQLDVDRELRGQFPTIKAQQLYTDPYQWHLRAGQWAYEPFSGSGSAIIAAESTGRRAAAMELAPMYADYACRRWQELSGKLPVHASSGEQVDFRAV